MPRKASCKVIGCVKTNHKRASNGKKCEGIIKLDNIQVMCCDIRASFNYKNAIGAKFCEDHKEDKMLNSQFKYCEENEECTNRENIKGSKICKDHYNILNNIKEKPKLRKPLAKECHFQALNSEGNLIYTCFKGSNYNFKGLKPRYCKDHVKQVSDKLPGGHISQMRNVRAITCKYYIDEENDCINIATCKINGIKMYCPDHAKIEKVTEMIKSTIIKKECKFQDCKTIPSYGYKDNGKNIYICCVSHIKSLQPFYEQEIKQLYKKCKFEGCEERARKESEEGKHDVAYCYSHGKGLKDNSKKICKFESGCDKEASHNIKTENEPIYCPDHKKNNMCSKKAIICNFEECTSAAYYSKEKDSYERFCAQHRDDNMKNYISPICIGCNEIQIRHYDNMLCANCDPKGKKRNAEFAVRNYLKDNNINFIYNKYLNNREDINYRPDFVIKFNKINIIIEVDENQHKDINYNSEEENKRMKSIFKSFNNSIIIRFNPDNYIKNNKLIESSLEQRLPILLNFINELSKEQSINLNNLYYMYYDCKCKTECCNIHTIKFVLD